MAFNDGMMQYFAKLGLDASSFLSGIEKSQAGILAFYRSSTIAMAGVTAAVYAVYSAQQRLGTLADEISDLSTTTGMSVDKIQRLQYAALLSNDSFGTVAAGINYLTLQMQKAGDTTSEAAKAFQSLGVDISGQSPDQVFEDTTTALMSMEDETLRNSIAMSIYGRSWKEMLPFMEDYIKNADKIGKTSTFNKKELQDLQDAKMAWDDLGDSVTKATGRILIGLGDINKAYVESQKEFQTGNPFYELFRDEGEPTTYSKNEAPTPKPAATPLVNPLEGVTTSEQAEIEILSKYTIPDLKKAYEDLKASGTATPKEIAVAYAEWVTATEQLRDRISIATGKIDTETTAMERQKSAAENLKDATDDLADARQGLKDIDTNYARDLQQLDPRNDVQGYINLKMRYEWDKEDQQKKVDQAQVIKTQAEVDTAAAEAEVQALIDKYDGSEISIVISPDFSEFYKGDVSPAAPVNLAPFARPQAAENMAAIPSPFISRPEPVTIPSTIHLPNISLPGSPAPATAGKIGTTMNFNAPITVNGDKSFERELQSARTRAGVRS